MLSVAENEKLTRTSAGTPAGEFLRRFWMPFLQSSDLAESDGEPIRLTLLGETLLAFRNTHGQVGLIQRNCPHRWASLFYGRNEEGGLRCSYHGWKFDIDGSCVDMPTETEDSNFKDKVKIVSYPVQEKSGVLWTYMGPRELRPGMPNFEWLMVPDSHRYVSWNRQANNYSQAIEGAIDSAHSNFLHSTLDAYHRTDAWRNIAERSGELRDIYHARDQHPKFFAQDTDYGVIIGARRNTGEDDYYWRLNLYLLPFYGMPPGQAKQKFFQAFVPIDDYSCERWTFTYNLDRPFTAAERAAMNKGLGLHAELLPGPDHIPVRNASNDYRVDRIEQKTLTFTGIEGTGEQDFSVQETMGPITPRPSEHLGTTDVGIIKARRRLLNAITALEDNDIEPYVVTHPDVYNIRATDLLLSSDASFIQDPKVKDLMATTWPIR